MLSSALVLAVLLVGGVYLLHDSGSSGSSGGAGSDRVHTSSVQVALQAAPDPSTIPGADPSASGQPSTPGGGSAAPTKPATPKPTTPTVPPANSTVVNELLAQINQLRADNGLPAYTLLSGLNASAHKHNLVMISGCGMSHQCPGEASVGARMTAQGVHWNSCGENVGWSGPHPNTQAALISAAEGLTTSMYNEKPPDDGHRQNLLSNSFHHVGIDVIRDSSGKVWLTQDFSN